MFYQQLRRSGRWLGIILAASVLSFLILQQQGVLAQGPANSICSRTDEFKNVGRLGQACRLANGFWKVRLKNGNFRYTHGNDDHTHFAATTVAAAALPPAQPSPIACAPAGTYRAVILYVNATDVGNQYSSRLGTIRSYTAQMQNRLNYESMLFGVTSSYRMACDADGQVTVRSVPLSINSSQNNIQAVNDDLIAKGFNSPFEKYEVYWEQSGCGGGVGWLRLDDSTSVDNGNNGGPDFAISWGFCGDSGVMMHESAHNMGAVQNSAPNTSGAGHCIDDEDVMCYNDGGSRAGQLHVVCGDFEHYDCNHDDYYNPNPPAGSYIATHWNIGDCRNRYINRSGCGGSTVYVPFTRLRSYNNTSSYVRHQNGRGRIDSVISPVEDSQFRMKPGLADVNAVSFESVNFPGSYLRHRNGEIWLDAADGTSLFNADATWWRRAGLADSNWTSYESYNFPNEYIRQSGGLLNRTAISTATDRADATFQDSPEPVNISTTGWYNVINQNSNKCLDASGSGTTDGTALIQFGCGTGLNQQWQFIPTDSGYFKVVPRYATTLFWDVSGVSTTNNALVQLWSAGCCANQQWKAQAVSTGVYRFVARHSGKCLDVPGASTTDNTQLQQYDCNDSNAQLFRLSQVNTTPTNTPVPPTATRTNTPVPPSPTIPPSSTNLALNKTATASGSCATTEGPDKAVNGSVIGGNADKWCDGSATKWMQVDLGTTYNLTQFIVRHAGAGGESTSFNTNAFNIQVSTNNSTWTTVVTVSGNTANVTTHPIPATAGRYVKLNITNSGSDGAARIYEFEVYGSSIAPTNTSAPPTATRTNTPVPPTATRTNTPIPPTATLSGVNLALNKPASSSGNCATTEGPDKAVNGSVTGGNADKWCSNIATKWMQVDLGTNYSLTKFIIKHAGAGGESTTWNTSAFDIQVSTNNSTWTTVVTISGNTASTTTHTITAATARYVRLNVTNGGGDGVARIYEFEVYGNTIAAPTNTPVPPTATTSGVAAWAPNVAYVAGQLVTYNGVTYRCLQAHTSQVGWEPPSTPALWQAA